MADRTKSEANQYLCLDDAALLAQCRVDNYRASGPGGQKRNKTSSAVRLRHEPTSLIVTAVESRSQHENKARALRRLRQAIALGVRTDLDLSRFALSELLASCISQAGRLCVGRKDQRYPAAVAEILDVFSACNARASETSDKIGVSTANLTRFIRDDPKLLACANQMRRAVGARPLV